MSDDQERDAASLYPTKGSEMKLKIKAASVLFVVAIIFAMMIIYPIETFVTLSILGLIVIFYLLWFSLIDFFKEQK